MDFLTIHEISREFDLPARVVRYRLLSCLQAGKLHEGEDFRREDYQDERHFVWKVNPLSFMRASGLKPVSVPEAPLPIVNEPITKQPVRVTKQPPAVNDDDLAVNDTEPDHEGVRDASSLVPIQREMIDFLKDQIRVKDGQFKEQGEHFKQINDLNVKLMGATLQQSQKIEELLRLGGNEREQPLTEDRVNENQSLVDGRVNESADAVNGDGSVDTKTA